MPPLFHRAERHQTSNQGCGAIVLIWNESLQNRAWYADRLSRAGFVFYGLQNLVLPVPACQTARAVKPLSLACPQFHAAVFPVGGSPAEVA